MPQRHCGVSSAKATSLLIQHCLRGEGGCEAAIVGSSNLSLGGVTHNTELNVRVFGDGNHAELSRWFNELGDEAEGFNLEEAHRTIADRAEEVPLIPRIICSEALL